MSRDERIPDNGPAARIDTLVVAMLDGQLSNEQAADLDRLLSSDADAAREYSDQCLMHALLRRELDHAWPEVVDGGARQADRAYVVCEPEWQVGRPHHADGLKSTLLRYWSTSFSLALSLVVLLAIVGPLVYWFHSSNRSRPGQIADRAGSRDAQAGQAGKPDVRMQTPESAGMVKTTTPVAILNRTVDVVWGKGVEPPTRSQLADGQLTAGQRLHLESGLAEITYQGHVRLVLQGPADLVLGGDNDVFLTEGRLTARLTDRGGLGFSVHTARSTFVDQGTEFGVDVAPGGDEKVHVFQGKVQFRMATASGALIAPRSLTKDEGARVIANAASVFLTNDAGEDFARSVDQSGRDRHTVAYWRFEDHPVGMLVSDTSKNAKAVRGTADSSGNGNDLFTYSTGTGPRFSADVPDSLVSHLERMNRGSLDNTAAPGSGVLTRDLYTSSSLSHASPLDIQRISPAQWSVEASVKPARLRRTAQTFVGRDSDGAANSLFAARLALQINAENQFAVHFIDSDDRMHSAIASRLSIAENRWYHVAASSDGRDLKLYVDCLDGQGYQLQAAAVLPQKGSTALGKVGDNGGWTVGRGLASDGRPGEWFQGWIDEVRVSDTARRPTEFLFMAAQVMAAQHSLISFF